MKNIIKILFSAAESSVQKFELTKTLKGHYGCVNTVNWNSTGSLLVRFVYFSLFFIDIYSIT